MFSGQITRTIHANGCFIPLLNAMTSSRPKIIQLKNVTKSFMNKKPIFTDINMVVEKGEFLFLTGVSGAGKSTIFKFLNGLEMPDEGEVIFNSKYVNKLNPKEMPLHRRQIGVVFQDYKLLCHKTAAENIAMPLRIMGLSSFKIEQKIGAIAKKIGIESLLKQRIESLSGGEQQLVAIARASIHKPLLILADEPTANLDQKTANTILKMLSVLNDEGMTVIIATHDINLIKAYDHRILIIKNRTIMEVY